MNVLISQVLLERIAYPKEWGFWRKLFTPQRWMVMEDVSVCIGEWSHTIKKGLVTDFASIPSCIKWLPTFGDSINYSSAALVHDDLYRTGVMGKRLCDAVLAGLIVDVDGGKEWQAEIVFLGVHWFGFSAWNAHRKNDRKNHG